VDPNLEHIPNIPRILRVKLSQSPQLLKVLFLELHIILKGFLQQFRVQVRLQCSLQVNPSFLELGRRVIVQSDSQPFPKKNRNEENLEHLLQFVIIVLVIVPVHEREVHQERLPELDHFANQHEQQPANASFERVYVQRVFQDHSGVQCLDLHFFQFEVQSFVQLEPCFEVLDYRFDFGCPAEENVHEKTTSVDGQDIALVIELVVIVVPLAH
jgi:hypothetical protein